MANGNTRRYSVLSLYYHHFLYCVLMYENEKKRIRVSLLLCMSYDFDISDKKRDSNKTRLSETGRPSTIYSTWHIVTWWIQFQQKEGKSFYNVIFMFLLYYSFVIQHSYVKIREKEKRDNAYFCWGSDLCRTWSLREYNRCMCFSSFCHTISERMKGEKQPLNYSMYTI